MLDVANNLHSNIKLVRQIGTSVSFLDVFIENQNGTLLTSVYRKDSTEPYIVPFRSDHPRHVLNNIIDGALMRALRYSSTLFNFNEERRVIQLMLLYNGLVFDNLLSLFYYFIFFFLTRYPPRYIYSRFKKFFINKSFTISIIPNIATENDLRFMRPYILNRPTAMEHQLASRIAKTIDPQKNAPIDDPLVQIRLNKQSNYTRNLIIHYTYEARLAAYKKHIHELWDQTFINTPLSNTKLIVGNRNSRNAIKILVRRRPRFI